MVMFQPQYLKPQISDKVLDENVLLIKCVNNLLIPPFLFTATVKLHPRRTTSLVTETHYWYCIIHSCNLAYISVTVLICTSTQANKIKLNLLCPPGYERAFSNICNIAPVVRLLGFHKIKGLTIHHHK